MANRFWVGGSATWNGTAGTKWSTTSGGASGAAVPTSSDDVFFNGSSGAGTITLSDGRVCKSLTCTGFTGTFSLGASASLEISGNLLLVSGMTLSANAASLFIVVGGASSTVTITTGGKSLGILVTGNGGSATATYSLQDNISCQAYIHSDGILTTNGKNITCSGNYLGAYGVIVAPSISGCVLNLGASVITITDTDVAFVVSYPSAPSDITVNAGTSEVVIGGTAAGFVIGGGYAFNKLTLSTTNLTAYVASDGTFASVVVNPDSFLDVNSSNVLTTAIFSAVGTSGHLATLQSSDITGSLSVASGTVSCDYVDMTNFPASGGASFYAGTHSVDHGGNTGWTFTAPPSGNVGTATGTATVSGTGASTATSSGTAAGSSTASATGNVLVPTTGTATGTSTATGQSGSIGTAAGSSTVAGTGSSTAAGVGSATGTATVSGVGQTELRSVGSAPGTSSTSFVGGSQFSTVGTAAGSSTATAAGQTAAVSVGTAVGTSSATGIVTYSVPSVGTSTGTSSVVGVSLVPQLELAILSFMSNAPVPVQGTMSDADVDLLGEMEDRLTLLSFMSALPFDGIGTVSDESIALLEELSSSLSILSIISTGPISSSGRISNSPITLLEDFE